MQAVLKRFAESIPQKPYCTNNFANGTRIMNRQAALRRKYIQPQIRNRLIGWLIFDIDRAGAALAHEAANLPSPTITVVNPKNSHAHLLYQLSAPVATTDKARISVVHYLEAIEGAYKDKLNSDQAYSGLLTKNPLHSDWRTSCNDSTYELSTLAEYVDLNKYRASKSANQNAGRNSTVFDSVRKSVYKIAKKFSTHEALYSEVLAQCFNANHTFSNKLSESEIRAISKSIAKYCWKHRFELLISREAIAAIEAAAMFICREMIPADVCRYAQQEVVKKSGYSADTVQRYLSNCAT